MRQNIQCAHLMCDVWPRVTDVSVHLAHDPNMFVAVQEGVLFVSHIAHAAAIRCSICFQARVGEYHYKSLSVFIVRRYGDVLFGNQLWKLWWWA